MTDSKVYDIAGIGIGPFNLGLAALLEPVGDLSSIFFDQKPCFEWHNGLLFDFAKMQVPFYADLVTGAEPASRFSFLSYLKRMGKLYQFAILEDAYITRQEYTDYCRWVTDQLDNLRFHSTVLSITYCETSGHFVLEIQRHREKLLYRAKRIVLGIGSKPFIPPGLRPEGVKGVIHSSDYLFRKADIIKGTTVSIIGSGQSAAEIVYDLMTEENSRIEQLRWYTRADRFFAMEQSKFGQEMTSPDYIDYFFNLPEAQKIQRLKNQNGLYKGINQSLLDLIYSMLYHKGHVPEKIVLQTNCDLQSIQAVDDHLKLCFNHTELRQSFSVASNRVILATGYESAIPAFVKPIAPKICWDLQGRYVVNRCYCISQEPNRIYVQHAETHTHGFNSADLGMGPYRNAIIINDILGYAFYEVEKRIAFQDFGIAMTSSKPIIFSKQAG